MRAVRLLVNLSALLMLATATHAAEEIQFKNLIDRTMACDNPSGNEIKDVKRVSAPPGKVFEKDSIKVITEPQTRSFTDAAGPGGCFLENLTWQSQTIKTKNGHDVPISLLTGFDVRAHADCGSGEGRTAAHIAKGEKITATCSVRASVFDVGDLK